jgi:shikimate kinase
MRIKKPIVLIGMKGCGKTTIGKQLATQLGYRFVDTDHLVEEAYQRQYGEALSFADIYQLKGSDYFRALESQVVQSLSLQVLEVVIATGGSTLLQSSNRKYLKDFGTVIYLQASMKTLLSRWKKKPPGFIDVNNIKVALHDYYDMRAECYQTLADLIIDIDKKTVSECVQFIQAALSQ